MAKQDDWVRMTLRLPGELHARLLSELADSPHSLNAEIVARLERSLSDNTISRNKQIVADILVRKAVASSLYHVTKTMAAIVEAGKQSENEGRPVDYAGMVRQMADEFKENYELEMEEAEEAALPIPKRA